MCTWIELWCIYEFAQNVKISDVGRPREMSEAVYQHMAEMTILVTQLVVEFAKKLPGFQDLAREDQINVLKVCSFVKYLSDRICFSINNVCYTVIVK